MLGLLVHAIAGLCEMVIGGRDVDHAVVEHGFNAETISTSSESSRLQFVRRRKCLDPGRRLDRLLADEADCGNRSVLGEAI